MSVAGLSIVEVGELLQHEQLELAKAALASPNERDSFEYGRVVGIYAGLALAWERIRTVYQDQQERDDKL